MDRFGEADTLILAFSTTNPSLFAIAERRLGEASLPFFRHEEVVTHTDRRSGSSRAELYQLFVRAQHAEEAEALLADLARYHPVDTCFAAQKPEYASDSRLPRLRRWSAALTAPLVLAIVAWLLLMLKAVAVRML